MTNITKTTMYCNNCCANTHIFKNCPDPITSYGLVCVHLNRKQNIKGRKNQLKYIDDNIRYLMIRKRNSFTYIEFMRAKYDLLEPEYIQKLFNHMTLYERELIMKNKFNFLWNNLWCIKKNGMTNPKNKSDFYKGIIKYNILQNGYHCSTDGQFYSTATFVKNCNKDYKFPEWYFPKGRKNQYESNVNCAKREFMEETNIRYNDFDVIHDLEKADELHKGTNGVTYKTVFYPAKYHHDYVPQYNPKNRNKFQKQEVGDVKWLTLKESLLMFRDYEQTKINMIKKMHKKLVLNLYHNPQL